MDGMSLLDVLRGVMLDPAEQAAYNADPGAYLERYGYDDVDSADLSEAFGLVADTLPPEVAQAAWQASADHGDEAFGGVTPEFDTQAGVDGPSAVAPDTEPPPEPADDLEPALSFGYGEADFSDAGTAGANGSNGVADSSVAADPDGAQPEGAFGDEAADDLDDATALDTGTAGDIDLDDESGPDDGWGEADGGLGTEDDGMSLDEVGDDSAEIDGLDSLAGLDEGLDDDGPDGTDVGSF